MPSPSQNSVDLPLLTLGGRVSQYDSQGLPAGASPFNQDVVFSGVDPNGVAMVTGVMTRPGMQNFYTTPFAGNPTVNYLKTFVDSQTIFHLLSLDGSGVMRDESPCPIPPGTPSIIGQVVAASLAQSDTLINREWIAISSSTHPGFGIDIPRSWDGQYFNRVSQVGPGAGPTVTQEAVTISTTSRAGNVTAVVLTAPLALVVGQLVTIKGVGDLSFNGTYPVCSVTNSTHFSYYNSAVGFPIQFLQRSGGVVTATVGSLNFGANSTSIAVSSDITINCPSNPLFNGRFTVASVNPANNTFTYNQAGADISGVASLGYVLQTSNTILYTISGLVVSNDVVTVSVTLGDPPPFSYTAYQPPFDVGLVVSSTIGSPISDPSGDTVTGTSTTSAAGTTYTFAGYSSPPDQTQGAQGYFALILTADGSSTGGSLALAGHIDQGIHYVSVSFITDTNYITKPSPPVPFYAPGNQAITCSQIPIGPPNVIGRILLFTSVITPPATGGDFYYFDGPVQIPDGTTFPSMVINDNTTTSYDVDFLDSVLLNTINNTVTNSTSASYLFNLLELGECSTVCAYSGRTFWCGERNKLPNMINLTFNGGFNGNTPLGWTPDPTYGTGGGPSPTPYWQSAYRITGDGNINHQGMIAQPAFQDYLGVNIISVNVGYSVRVRLRATAPLATGVIGFNLYSPSMGLIGEFLVNCNTLTTSYQEYIGIMIGPAPNIPSDLLFRVYGIGILSGQGVDIACIEPYPTLSPYLNTQVKGSYALDPESFDQTTGIMKVGPQNGYAARGLFQLLDNKLYIVTELGFYSTQDDGQNEPDLWSINIISATMGTGSARGVGIGDSWAIIVHKTGAYIFWGSEPVCITKEIQPDWDTINWDYDQTIYCTVDTVNKRIHIGAPVNGATSPNVEFVCDYAQLANAEGQVSGQDIASHPQAYYSVYNPTKVVAPGKARKWTLWNISMNCATLAIRSDASYHMLRGNGTSTGNVYDQQPTQLSDDGVAINSQYQTAFMPQIEDEQALALGSHRKYFKYLSHFSCGSGILNWVIYGAMNQRALNLYSDNLNYPQMWDLEKNINWVGERASFLFGTYATGSWFKLTKLCPTLQREIVTPVRGSNV